ncbi:MAG: penicillin-binding transpeptidase domain-containing protein [Gemmatimonadota bacterium]
MSGPRPVKARTHRNRLRAVQAGFVLLALGYVARLVQLQVVDGERWSALATAQNAKEKAIPARRGGIYDRNGRPLALDEQEWRAFLAPRELSSPERAVAAVDRILGLSPREEAKLRGARSGWVGIPRRISSLDRGRLMGAIHRGLHFEPVTSRVYPQGALARSLIGAVGSEGHGVSGVERQLDSLLRGHPGASLARQDALGETYWLPDAQLSPPRPGQDVYLTIDAELQGIAEHALQRALAQTGASGGDVLLLDPNTGELLAVASRRGDGYRGVPAFTDPYEPGSTFKPFLLAALLGERRAKLTDSVYTEHGMWRYGARLIRDVHPYDTLSVAEVVRFSSNIGAVKLSRRLRPGEQYRYLRDFGFGIPTGILYPAESSGRLPRPAEWSGLSQASLAMGYEVLVTSLQLAAAYGALANGGVLMRPYLVREVRDRMGRVTWHREPEPLRRVLKPDVAARVGRVLETVVSEGTGLRAAMADLPVAGKTGTARLTSGGRYERGRYAASFVGYTPADDPSLVILTRLKDPQGAYYGGSVAAPVSREILEAALATRGVVVDRHLAATRVAPLRWGTVAPERESGPFIFAIGREPHPWPAAAREENGAASTLPDLRGLSVRAAVARLHGLGLRVKLAAAGRVRGQSPAPGRRLKRGSTVVLR